MSSIIHLHFILLLDFRVCEKFMDSSKNHHHHHHIHVVLISSPGMGHLIPVLVLANHLKNHHNMKTTLLSITTSATKSSQASQILNFSQQQVEIIEIPLVHISHLINPNMKMVTQLFMMAREALPLIKSAIAAMKHRPNALILDLFSASAFSIAEEFNMPKYVYVPSTAWFTALTIYCPILDKTIEGQYVDQVDPLTIPGCKPVRPEDVVEPMLDRNDQQYYEYLRQGVEFGLSDGILMNTWEEIEYKTVEALKENEILRGILKVPVYAIGPLRRSAEMGCCSKSEVIEWLDMQPSESVLYVAFGSGGALSDEQMIELACGLELSKQRFVWVVRPPIHGDADNSYLSGSECGPHDYLPEGFIKRTNEVGLIVSAWVEQVTILKHPSIGGFLSHCGWNSTLESIASGVPMIAWPLFAEQRLNATILTEELGVAVRPEVLPTTKVVSREETEKLIRTIMHENEGKAIRDKMAKLKASAENALSKEGSSYKSMCAVLSDIKMRQKS